MIRRRVHEILEPAHPGDRVSSAFDVFIVSLIAFNIAAIVLESIPSIGAAWSAYFAWFEIVSVAVFSIEYALRVWSSTADIRYQGAIRGRLQFMASPLAIVDVLAILPSFVFFVGFDLRALRVFRLFRFLRIAKLFRYSESLRMFGTVIRRKREEFIITLTVGAMLLLLASTVVYFAERDAQPEAFSSIPAAMWWAVATLTTVGYGDMAPITPLGRFLGSFVALLGIGMIALPTAILGGAFMEALAERRAPPRCPHCGGDLS